MADVSLLTKEQCRAWAGVDRDAWERLGSRFTASIEAVMAGHVRAIKVMTEDEWRADFEKVWAEKWPSMSFERDKVDGRYKASHAATLWTSWIAFAQHLGLVAEPNKESANG